MSKTYNVYCDESCHLIHDFVILLSIASIEWGNVFNGSLYWAAGHGVIGDDLYNTNLWRNVIDIALTDNWAKEDKRLSATPMLEIKKERIALVSDFERSSHSFLDRPTPVRLRLTVNTILPFWSYHVSDSYDCNTGPNRANH